MNFLYSRSIVVDIGLWLRVCWATHVPRSDSETRSKIQVFLLYDSYEMTSAASERDIAVPFI
jgi:hypothetical protein